MALNDKFAEAQAEALAARVASEVGADLKACVNRAFQLALQRDPEPQELQKSLQRLEQLSKNVGKDGSSEPTKIALRSFCLAVLNLNEVIYVD